MNDTLGEQNIQLYPREYELKVTLEKLSERNFDLDQLMYKTSHDLRSPLSSIIGLVSLSKIDKDETNIHQYLVKIEGRIKKLDEFIKSMLTSAKGVQSKLSRLLSIVNPPRFSLQQKTNLGGFRHI